MISHVGHWSYEVAGHAIEWSDELWKIFGREPNSAELNSATVTPWIRHDFRAFHEQKMGQMLALKPGETVKDFIYCLVRPDGEQRWVEIFLEAEFAKGGKPMRFFGVVADITERKRADEALHLTRFSVDTATDGIFWITPEARIVDVNAAACRALGYTREELLKLSIPDVDPHYSAERWAQHFVELRQHGSMTFETEQRKKDGWLIPVEIVANYIEHGDVVRSCGVVRDITVRKKAEQELRDLAATLEDQVKARTLRLRTVSAQLTLTEERERRLLALELHDNLSQLLAIIRIKLMPLAASEFQPAVKEVMALVDKADQSARMVTRQLSPPILNTMGLAPALAWLADEKMTTYGLSVRIDNQAGPIALVFAIEAVLFRSVRELLINVVKHAKASDASIAFQCDESRVTLVVSDEGCGFDPASFRDPLPGKHSFGLSSIYERITNIGGEMHVVSCPGHGTTITLSVPRSIAVKEYQLS
jgi:PAS domain S-box-containing protein